MTKPQSGRLMTLDLLRGFFLFIIIVDHVELFPSVFDLFSGKGRLWVSAAEGFFFISGLLVGYIYRRKLAEGMRAIIAKTWKRAGVLYFWSVALTLGFTLWGASLGAQFIKYGLPAHIDWPDLIWQTLTLHYTYGWADFLSHYVVFMLAAPLVMYLLSKQKWWLVVLGSVALWAVRGQSFKMAWQLIFVGGMVCGYYWVSLQAKVASWPASRKVFVRRALMWAAGVTFGASYLSVYVLGGLNDHSAFLPPWLAHITTVWDNWNTYLWRYFEKWTLEPGRIVCFALWFSALYLLVDRYTRSFHAGIRMWLTLLGTNSLFVYGAHSVVVFVIHVWFPRSLGLWENGVITAGALLVVTTLVWLKVAIDQEPRAIHVRAKRSLRRMISSADTPTS